MRKKKRSASEKLWQSDYERLLDNLPVAIVQSDRKGLVIFANRAARTLFGPDVVGKNARELYGQSREPTTMNPQSVKSALEDSPASQLMNVTVPIRLARGTTHDMLMSFLLDRNTDTIVGVIVPGVIELQRALANIAESLTGNNRWEHTLSVITEQAHLLCRADRAYIKLYDDKKRALVFSALSSSDPAEGFPEPYSDIKRGMTGFVFRRQKLYRSGDVQAEPPEMYYAIFPDTVSKVVAPLLYKEPLGGYRCYGVISVDGKRKNQFNANTDEILTILAKHAALAIVQVKLLEEIQSVYEQLLKEIRAARDAIGAGDILHDGKNLVRDLIDEAEALLDELSKTSLSKKKAKELEKRLDGLRDLRDLMQELLVQLRRGASEDRGFDEGDPVDLRALAQRVMNVMPLGDTNITIILEPDARPYELVYGKATRLLLMLYNLIANAVAAIKQSGRPGEVVIKTSPTPGRPGFRRIEIRDNGPGLPKDVLRFIRKGEEYSGIPGGFGLGLLTVRETVKDLRGTIDVDSRFGGGTKFTIDLPGPREEKTNT